MHLTVENKVVTIFNNEGDETPFLYQPHYPDGTMFDSDEEALSWGEQWIEMTENPESLLPQNGRDEERKPRTPKINIAKAKLEMSGLTNEELDMIIKERTAVVE